MLLPIRVSEILAAPLRESILLLIHEIRRAHAVSVMRTQFSMALTRVSRRRGTKSALHRFFKDFKSHQTKANGTYPARLAQCRYLMARLNPKRHQKEHRATMIRIFRVQACAHLDTPSTWGFQLSKTAPLQISARKDRHLEEIASFPYSLP